MQVGFGLTLLVIDGVLLKQSQECLCLLKLV